MGPTWGQHEPKWANLGLSWAPRGHLELSWGLLGAKSFLEPRVQNFPAPRPADLMDFGVQFGAQNGLLFGNFGGHVLD